MIKINQNKAGLAAGAFIALVHAIWAIVIAIIPNQFQSFLDWIFKLHFISNGWQLTAFNFIDAILLVFITFIIGYIFGWVLAGVCNMVVKKIK